VRIPTAKGHIDTADMGFTLMHEHLFVRWDGIEQNYPQLWDRQREIEGAIRKLHEVHGLGVRTLVDLTVIGGLGRDVSMIREVAERTPVNIIVATGCYYVVPPFLGRQSVDETATLFVSDIEAGIAGSGVRAAVIKCATEEAAVSPLNEHVLRACARAQRRTGVPLYTHSNPHHRNGLLQWRIFEGEGVKPSAVVIGHSGDTEDLDYVRQLVSKGVWIGYDRFGLDSLQPLEPSLDRLAALIGEGYADRIVISHDYCATLHKSRDEAERLRERPNWRYTLIPEVVLPALRRRGVSEENIHRLTVENPRRVFEEAAA
jgi:phosphotriesterase-related protein